MTTELLEEEEIDEQEEPEGGSYTFKELLALGNERAIDKARDWFREGIENDWHNYLLDEWKIALDQLGFDNPDIQYSGFWSQGDGASFTSRSVDVRKLLSFMARPPAAGGIGGDDGKEDFLPMVVKKTSFKVCEKSAMLLAYLGMFQGEISASVDRTTSNYSHEYTCRFRIDEIDTGGEFWGDRDAIEKLADAFAESAEDFRKDLCQAIYKDLNGEYDYLTSDEAYIEDGEANDWKFDEWGERIDE